MITPARKGYLKPMKNGRWSLRQRCALLLTCALMSGVMARAQVSPAINAYLVQLTESSYASHVLALEAFGTRQALQSNRDAVTSFLETRFRSFGITDVAFDSFTSGSTTQRNVIATIPGTQPSSGEIIICAHYDSYAIPATAAPGADDNASGMAAVLEMARILKSAGYTPNRTLRFIGFGAEELGLVGSSFYASSAYAAKRQITQVQNYDMIGYCPAGSPTQVRVIWYDNARDLAERDSSVIRRYTTLTPVLSTQYRTQSDSYPFYAQGFKAFFNIEQTLIPSYHTAHDSSTLLNMDFASQVARSGLALLLETDGVLTATTGRTAQLPAGYSLEQNYPNPFNSETVIRYQMPADAQVRIVVTDLLGREVALIANGIQPAGIHDVAWDASGFTSGIYLCRLTAGTFTQTRKIILLR
jgi:hypothetical protein